MVKIIPIYKPIFEPGPAILWQEDIRELLNILSENGIWTGRVASGGYQYESADDLFANSGPNIRLLFVNCERPQVQIKFSRKHSICTLPSVDADPDLYQKLRNFFLSRRTARAYLTPLRLVAFFVATTAYFTLVIWTAEQSKSQGVLAGIFLVPLFGFFAIAWGVPKRTMLMRNYSKYSAAFERRHRLLRYLEWAAAAIVGGILTIAAQHTGKFLG